MKMEGAMSLSEERMQVLKMIESGTISAEQGASLLAAMGEESSAGVVGDVEAASAHPRWLRVAVKDLTTGAPKVNVRLPIGLVSVGVKMGARFVPGTQGVEIADLLEAVRRDVPGKITEAEDVDNNELVEIYLE
jgi:hypothetical protein